MRSQLVRWMVAFGMLLLCAHTALSGEPPCAVQLNRWWHWLRHDWDNDGTPENRYVECAFFDEWTGWEYPAYYDGGEMKICACPSNHRTGQGNPYWHAHLKHTFPMIGLLSLRFS